MIHELTSNKYYKKYKRLTMHMLLKFGPHKVAKEALISPESLLKRNSEVDENCCILPPEKCF